MAVTPRSTTTSRRAAAAAANSTAAGATATAPTTTSVPPAPAIAPRVVAAPAVNVTVASTGLDTYLPPIKQTLPSEIISLFKCTELTKIEGEPNYHSLVKVRRELQRNAIASKVSFGGGTRGCLGVAATPAVFLQATGHNWVVPISGGAYPTFPFGATEHEKKRIIAEFIVEEQDIIKVDITAELLKGQFLDCIEETYIMELRDPMSEYDDVTLLELLDHVFTNYGEMDDHLVNKNKERFDEQPDMNEPIDNYFVKQEECRTLSNDSDTPISDADMVQKLTTHMGKTNQVNKANFRFKHLPSGDRTWEKGKVYYRAAFRMLKDMEKAAGEEGLYANGAVRQGILANAEQQARDEMATKLGESFDTLACAATIKSDVMESHTKIISTLTATNAELVATNKVLVAQLASLKGRGTTVSPPTNPAGHATVTSALTTSGLSVSVTYNPETQKHYFNSKQSCGYCKRDAITHVPVNCLHNPENKDKLDAYLARQAARKAGKV